MNREERRLALREIAAGLSHIDRAVYEAFGADPLEPVIGEGDRRARVAIFGRDPGRQEIEHRTPFIGAGGVKVRRELHQAVHGRPSTTLAEHLEAGTYVFWANTVPYKPVGNVVWPEPVRQQVMPIITDLLVRDWDGHDVIALGKEALFWFARDAAGKARAQAQWKRADCFETHVELPVRHEGLDKVFRVHPLPHPSPLNATWAPRFPGLMKACLERIGLDREHWRIDA